MTKGLNFYQALFLIFILLKWGFGREMTLFELFIPIYIWVADRVLTEVFKLYKFDQKIVQFYIKMYLKLNEFIAKRRTKNILRKATKNDRLFRGK